MYEEVLEIRTAVMGRLGRKAFAANADDFASLHTTSRILWARCGERGSSARRAPAQFAIFRSHRPARTARPSAGADHAHHDEIRRSSCRGVMPAPRDARPVRIARRCCRIERADRAEQLAGPPSPPPPLCAGTISATSGQISPTRLTVSPMLRERAARRFVYRPRSPCDPAVRNARNVAGWSLSTEQMRWGCADYD